MIYPSNPTFIKFETTTGYIICANIEAIDTIYHKDQIKYGQDEEYGVLLRSGVTYIISKVFYNKIMEVIAYYD